MSTFIVYITDDDSVEVISEFSGEKVGSHPRNHSVCAHGHFDRLAVTDWRSNPMGERVFVLY